MSVARFLVGDVRDRLAEIPDGSVDLLMTSPPFLALRSYLPVGHPDKGREIGAEPSPAEFIDTLLALTAEWRRVLAPHGSIVVELGDTYSGSGGGGGDWIEGSGQRVYTRGSDIPDFSSMPKRKGDGWPLAKSLVGIPHMYHLSLAYGRNLLTGEPSPAGEWRVRNVVAWCRPNPPVGALGDKFRPATSYLTIACVSPKRYFDLDAVRGPGSPNTHARVAEGVESRPNTTKSGDDDRTGGNRSTLAITNGDGSAPPNDWWDEIERLLTDAPDDLDHRGRAKWVREQLDPGDIWEIPTRPYPGAHYATYPEALCVRPIEAMCPRKVCTVCGKPSERIVKVERLADADDSQRNKHANGERPAPGRQDRAPEVGWEMGRTTLGWSDCECPGGDARWRPGVVLDPFAGSGTTLAVATARGRDAIGIDFDERNLDLARQRIGMFLVEEPVGGDAA